MLFDIYPSKLIIPGHEACEKMWGLSALKETEKVIPHWEWPSGYCWGSHESLIRLLHFLMILQQKNNFKNGSFIECRPCHPSPTTKFFFHLPSFESVEFAKQYLQRNNSHSIFKAGREGELFCHTYLVYLGFILKTVVKVAQLLFLGLFWPP